MPQYRLINNIISFVCWRLAFLVGIILIACIGEYIPTGVCSDKGAGRDRAIGKISEGESYEQFG